MHELAVTTSILKLALDYAGDARVTDLYLVVGQLSSIVDDSVQFYWDIISQDSAAAGSRLHFRRIAAALECSECGARYGMTGEDFVCPQCGSARVRIVAGEEFYLDSIEVETASEETP